MPISLELTLVASKFHIFDLSVNHSPLQTNGRGNKVMFEGIQACFDYFPRLKNNYLKVRAKPRPMPRVLQFDSEKDNLWYANVY